MSVVLSEEVGFGEDKITMETKAKIKCNSQVPVICTREITAWCTKFKILGPFLKCRKPIKLQDDFIIILE